jgi:hypothetical protein
MLKITSLLEFLLFFFLDAPPVLCVSFFSSAAVFLVCWTQFKKNLCSEAASRNTLAGFWLLKSLAIFYQLTFFLRTNHVCFLIRYDTLVLMSLCTILKKSVFFLRRIIRIACSLLFASFFIILQNVNRYFSNFSQLFAIYSDFFHFFFKLLTLKLSNSSASSGFLLPLSRGLFTIRLVLFKLIN